MNDLHQNIRRSYSALTHLGPAWSHQLVHKLRKCFCMLTRCIWRLKLSSLWNFNSERSRTSSVTQEHECWVWTAYCHTDYHHGCVSLGPRLRASQCDWLFLEFSFFNRIVNFKHNQFHKQGFWKIIIFKTQSCTYSYLNAPVITFDQVQRLHPGWHEFLHNLCLEQWKENTNKRK